MTVVSSKEFVSNHNKYFGMALKEQLYVRNGGNIFQVSIAKDKIVDHKKPDDDFRRAITADEFMEGALKIIDKIYANQ